MGSNRASISLLRDFMEMVVLLGNVGRSIIDSGVFEEYESHSSVVFEDEERTVRWPGGRIRFRRDARDVYRLFKMTWKTKEEGLEMCDAAGILFGDELANLDSLVHTIRRKIKQEKFPYILEASRSILKFSKKIRE